VFGPDDAEPSAVGRHAWEARPGHHLAPRPASNGGNIYAALGPGLTLLALGADREAVDGFASAADALGVPLAVCADTAAEGRQEYGARLVLVRPDQFVAWAGDRAHNPEAILARVIGRP
jgi:hypothetical protein